MIRSYKNPDYIYSLNNKELKDYYDCLSHHHFQRHFCNLNTTRSTQEHECPCNCQHGQKHDHFCTGLSQSATFRHLNDSQNDESLANTSYSFYDPSLVVCENYPPSYTLKEEQIKVLNKDLKDLKKSKQVMKKALNDLDKLLDNFNDKKDDGLNEVERFYRSDKFIGSSMNITSLKKFLPRTDIRPAQHTIEPKDEERAKLALYGNAIYQLDNREIFADSELLEKEKKLKKPPPSVDLKLVPTTAVIYCNKK